MDIFVEHVDIWAAPIPDRPGGLASVLTALRDAKCNPQSIIARRTPEHDGKGVVFVWPLETDREIAAAAQVGFNVARSMHAVRVMGRERPGVVAELTQAVADAGVDLHGFSAAVISPRFVAYFAVGSVEDANRIEATLGGMAMPKAA